MRLTRITRHLRENNLNYLPHMKRSLGLSIPLGIGCVAALIHAFFPFLLETVASDIIKKIYKKI